MKKKMSNMGEGILMGRGRQPIKKFSSVYYFPESNISLEDKGSWTALTI